MEIIRKPAWLSRKIQPGKHREVKTLLSGLNLNTICQEALCPNITECFKSRQATFLILGKACTRACTFCNVTKERPLPPDSSEPLRVAEAVKLLNLRHIVITSPTRDDLNDGGAGYFACTVDAIRKSSPQTKIEILIPDFQGNLESLRICALSGADIVGHNIETIERLYSIRKGADYSRSLRVLKALKDINPELKTKSGLMAGLGETADEVFKTMEDIVKTGCKLLSVGQYLPPSKKHQPLVEYVAPETFELYKTKALGMGFTAVESGPYVRSSYLAENYLK